jgi:hypothetical protein
MEYQNEEEFKQLLDIFKARQPKYVLEIGSMFGDTLHEWIKYSAPDATIVSIDLRLPPSDGRYEKQGHFHNVLSQQWAEEYDKDVYMLVGNSHSSVIFNEVAHVFPDGIDFLFIDGDHSYEGVKNDYMMYSKLVSKDRNPASIIAFHDVVGIEGCAKLWNEVKHESYVNDLISADTNGWGIGVMYV